MTTYIQEPTEQERNAKTFANIVYALQAFSFFTAVFTGLIAIIVNYVKLDDARGTWVESHFRWQIKTFWVSFALGAAAVLFAITIVGIPIAWLLGIFDTVWVVYRIVRGFIALNENKALPT